MNTKEMEENEATEQISDEDLVQRVQKGEEDAYKELVTRYQEKLTRYALRFTAEDEANDIVQESFIKAHKNIESFDTSRRFSPWIYRITRNTALSHIDRPAVRDTVTLDPDTENALMLDDEKSALEQWLQKELRLHVREAIEALPDNYAEVIYLRYIDDLSYQEISEIIDKPVNTVGTLIRRAKKKMLTILLEEEK